MLMVHFGIQPINFLYYIMKCSKNWDLQRNALIVKQLWDLWDIQRKKLRQSFSRILNMRNALKYLDMITQEECRYLLTQPGKL